MDEPLLPELPGYENPQLIAHGTTALVFRAVQSKLNRPVAIKVITANAGSMRANAARELATTVALSSQPHIVSIIDTGETDDGCLYIVMEYCEGGSYAQILRQRGPLPVDEVIEVGTKIGEALQAAHQAGIIHRDVKPSNILRSRYGPALTDFGIARAPEELSETLTREMMTPHHASPEALLHQAQSGLSDVYSLASTMWTLLVGHPPFADPTRPPLDLAAFRDRVLHEPLPPMPREDVPEWLVAELTRAMAKQPALRHASAAEFAEALKRGALGLPPSVAQQPLLGMPGSHSPVWTTAPRVLPPRPNPPPVQADPSPARRAGTTPTFSSPPLVASVPPQSLEAAPPAVPSQREATSAHSAQDTVDRYAETLERPRHDTVDSGPPDWATESGSRDAPSPRRFSEEALLRPPGIRRGRLLAALGAGVVLAGVAAVVFTVADHREQETSATAPQPSASAAPTRFLTADTQGAPRDIRLRDEGTSVTITWTDPSSGQVPFVVSGRTEAGELIGLKQVDRSVTQVTYGSLDPKVNYCFLVTAVYSGSKVATSGWTCTRR